MNALDAAALIILAIGGLAGYQKGLITGFSHFVGKIASLVIALLYHQQFLQTLEPFLHLRDKIQPKISAFLLRVALERIGGGGSLSGSAEKLVQPAISQTAVSLTDYILMIGSVILLFLLTSLAINIFISIIVNPIAGSMGIINRGGGLLFGVLSSFVAVCLIVGLTSPLLTIVNSKALKPETSELYPVFISGYVIIKDLSSVIAEDLLTNPLKEFVFTDKSV